jgi:transcriptional regulator with XRE-family HTH domain
MNSESRKICSVYRIFYGWCKMASLGEKIRLLRKEKGLTLDELAIKAESSKSYIWELENRTPPSPSAQKLAKVAEALGVTLSYFLDDGSEVSQDDAVDVGFFRKYQNMDAATKAKVRKMIDLWDDE